MLSLRCILKLASSDKRGSERGLARALLAEEALVKGFFFFLSIRLMKYAALPVFYQV